MSALKAAFANKQLPDLENGLVLICLKNETKAALSRLFALEWTGK